jgi:hypothetical protein
MTVAAAVWAAVAARDVCLADGLLTRTAEGGCATNS